jgi:hypothetical protein
MGSDDDPLEIDEESSDWLLELQSRRGSPANRFSEDQVRRLRNAIEPFAGSPFPAEGRWRKMRDDELWLQVVSQVVALGDRLQQDATSRERLAWDRLVELDDDEALVAFTNALRKVRGRTAGDDENEATVTNALVYDLRVLQGVGGPRRYFRALARKKTDLERVATLCLELMAMGSKNARDLLVEIGMARDFITFDARLQKVLEALGIATDGFKDKDRSRAIEEMLLAAVPSLGVSCLAHFDRVVCTNADDVVSRVTQGSPPSGTLTITLGDEGRAELDRLADERGLSPRELARLLLESILGTLRR